MAFRIETTLKGYEYRTTRTGEVEGNKWMQIIVEHPESCDQCSISVPADMRGIVDVLGLTKGTYMDVTVIASAGNSYSRMQLVKIERIYDEEGEVTEVGF